VDLVVGSTPVHLASDCASDTWNPGMATTPVGYLLEGGVAPGLSNLNVYGCVSKAVNSEGISLLVSGVKAPGTFTSGTATYTDAGGAAWSNGGALMVTVTKLGAVGGTIEGTLSATVTHPPSQVAQTIAGSFKVCHIGDELVP
jgi:hypothetical protein